MYFSLNEDGEVNFERVSLDFELANETTPLLPSSQPTSSAYLGLSSSSALSIADNNRSLQLSDAAFESAENTRVNVESKEFKLELKKRINREFPSKYVFFNSIVSILFCTAMIISERFHTEHFVFDDLKILSYRTLNGLILLGSAINIIYSVLALISIKCKNYFLIQMNCILSLIGSFMAFVYLIVFNIIVLIFTLLGTSDYDYVCILLRSLMILYGVVITILDLLFLF